MQKNVKDSAIGKWLAAIGVFCAVTAIFWLSFRGISQYVTQDSTTETQDMAARCSDDLGKLGRGLVAETDRLADAARTQRIKDDWFVPEAKKLIASDSRIMGVQYSPLGRPAVSWPAGFTFNTGGGLTTAFMNMQGTVMTGDGVSVVMSPVEAPGGTLGIISMSPVLAYNSKTQKFDYLGNVAVLFKLPDALEGDSLQAIRDSGNRFRIYGNNPALENDGLMATSEGAMAEDAVSASAKVPGGYWQVKLNVPDSWTQKSHSVSIIISLIAGLLLGGLTLWGLTVRQQRNETKHLLMRDSITGIGNKKALKLELERMCRQLKGHFVVAFIDIDDMKGINRSRGRDAGDAFLKATATRMAACLKKGDSLFRLEADSFVAIIDHESLDGVSKRLEDIKAGAAVPFDYNGAAISAGISVGCSAFPIDARKPAELIQIADKRMNTAKGIMITENIDWLADEELVEIPQDAEPDKGQK
ncbi:GGDEF domain-containing protein [Anaerovibrio sp.]|uniref:sensor domain-containing diguanylate cyclase n=1 Tax=Anaerovibrio sp. TaxID=1872532 RepID=UPI0025D70785|nr:GGDEF domain-containing protein [Anaerovibrio sp.]